MLESISIEKYRNLDGVKARDFAPFNLIVGANNSGKTSLLESIFLHCAPLNFHALLTLLSHREGGIRADNRYLVDRFRWFFTDPKANTNLSLRISGRYNNKPRTTGLLLEVSGIDPVHVDKNLLTSKSSAESIIRTDGAVEEPSREESGLILGIAKMTFTKSGSEKKHSLQFTANTPVKIPPAKIPTDIPAVITSTLSTSHPDLRKYSIAVKTEHHKMCIEMIRRIEPSIHDITLLTAEDGTPELFVLRPDVGYSPLGNEGRGIIQMYQIATSMVQCRNGILLVDELENAIHKSAMVHYVDWLVSVALQHNIQVFATTHSLECIDVVVQSKMSEEGKLALFKIDGKRKTIKRYSSEDLKYSRIEFGMDIRID